MMRCTVAALVAASIVSAQDVRNIGMGCLSFLAESDANRLDMYDFGRNPAGLYRAAPVSFTTESDEYGESPSYLPEEGGALPDYSNSGGQFALYAPTGGGLKLFDVFSLGQPIPSEFYEYFSPGFYWLSPLYPAQPVGGGLRSRQSDAATDISGGWSWLHAKGDMGLDINTPQVKFVRAGAAGSIDYGFDVSAFYMMMSGAQLFGPGAGAGVVLPIAPASLGADLRYYHPIMHSSGVPSEHGNAFRPGLSVVLEPVPDLKLGVRGQYTMTKFLDQEYAAPSAGLRAGFSRKDVPIVAGLQANWSSVRVKGTWSDERSGTLQTGAGLGLSIPEFFLGVEVSYAMVGETTSAGPGTRELALRGGAEYKLGTTRLRLGYVHSSTDDELSGGTLNQSQYTFGVGFDLSGGKADVAYVLVPHSDQSGYTDHVLYFAIKFATQ